MTIKLKIVILILCAAAVFITVRWGGPTASTGDRPTRQIDEAARRTAPPTSTIAQAASDQKSNEPAEFAPAQEEMLKVIVSGLRSFESTSVAERSRLAGAGNWAIESLLQDWNPSGMTTNEIKALFGVAKEENDDHLLYAFDNGSYAWLYQFVIKDGKVVEVNRPLSE